MNYLEKYGLTQRFVTLAAQYPGLETGRIVSQSTGLYKAVSAQGECFAEVSGKFRFEATGVSDFPVVGDFVMLDRDSDEGGNAIIHHVLTRKSAFERTAAGVANQVQIVASNIDFVFICMSLNKDYNLRRLERYLCIAWDSGAIPVVVLTKADLCGDLEKKLAEVSTVAIGADIIVTAKDDSDSYGRLADYLKAGVTASFIGSSGVGKSTLVNRLAGEERLSTLEIRADDDKGRHTTTRRELIPLPQGGAVIDTPGMRELGIESADLSKTFSDIDALAENCKFTDCAHGNEPGCAVQAAIESGSLDEGRFESYRKLKKEARYDGLTSKQIETEKLNAMFSEVGGMKQSRKFLKEKNKRR